MFSGVVIAYLPTCYLMFSIFDYMSNKNAYQRVTTEQVIRVLMNTLVIIPLFYKLNLSFSPIEMTYFNLETEVYHMIVDLLFYEVYFYTIHYLCHHNRYLYWIHKRHHEELHPVGFLAWNSNPVEATFVNLGSTFVMHYFFKFSLLHFLVTHLIGISLAVLYSHSDNHDGDHKKHHRMSNCNYGILFLDWVLGTHR